MWSEWIIEKFGGPQPAEIDKDVTRSERKKKIEGSRKPLKIVAEQLVDRDNSDLHKLWANEWESRTRTFQQLLRRLRKMILPRIGKRPLGNSPQFKKWKGKAKELRNVGGLPYTRLATIRGLYQVMRAFHMRPEPDNLRAGIEREAEAGNHFGLRIFKTLDHLRENRVKQLASRIVEAALGPVSPPCRSAAGRWRCGRCAGPSTTNSSPIGRHRQWGRRRHSCRYSRVGGGGGIAARITVCGVPSGPQAKEALGGIRGCVPLMECLSESVCIDRNGAAHWPSTCDRRIGNFAYLS
jgi:hypothetical protein